MVKTKIVIAGIGGVGGYFGGLLAKAYAGVKDVEIYFIARGAHLTQIQNFGLKVIKGEVEFTANPQLATANAIDIGKADYIILSTKNYDLTDVLTNLAYCITNETVILPLLNGVEAVEKIREKFPKNLVPAGFAYIVSVIKDLGVVENIGNRQEIYFGLDHQTDEKLLKLEGLLKFAGIECTLTNQISPLLWEKFVFLSCIATATSYFQKTVGELLEQNEEDLINLLEEVKSIAVNKKINIDAQVIQKALKHYQQLPYLATSSMQRDFEAKKDNTELNSITGYVVNEAKKLSIPTPNFTKAYLALKS